jgi:hypothetical protein
MCVPTLAHDAHAHAVNNVCLRRSYVPSTPTRMSQILQEPLPTMLAHMHAAHLAHTLDAHPTNTCTQHAA